MDMGREAGHQVPRSSEADQLSEGPVNKPPVRLPEDWMNTMDPPEIRTWSDGYEAGFDDGYKLALKSVVTVQLRMDLPPVPTPNVRERYGCTTNPCKEHG